MTDPSDIDRVLQRLRDDPAFRTQLQADPQPALAEYQLSDGDLDRIEQRVADAAATPNAGVATFFGPPAARPWWRAKGFAAALGAVMLVGVGGGALAETTRRSPAIEAPAASGAPGSVVVDGVDAMTPVAYTACPAAEPGAAQLGSFHRGDQVWVVGRDESAAWLQVRNPAGERVWVPAATVTAEKIDTMPIVPCDLDARGSAGSALDPSGSVPPGSAAVPETTTPTDTSTTTAITPPPTSATSTTAAPPSTTSTTPGPGDHAGPSIQNLAGNPTQIWEHYAPGGGRCVTQTTTTVSASVSDPSTVAAVDVEWAVAGAGGASGTAAMTGTGTTWSGVVGPFEWNGDAVPPGGADVTITIRARDGVGNITTASTTVRLHSAQECIG